MTAEALVEELDAAGRITVPKLRALARRTGRNQNLAEQLWATGRHDARLLAGLIAQPALITGPTMDQWANDLDSWDLCDCCAYYPFGESPLAWQKINEWARSEKEFVRRAAFATIAGISVHDKRAADEIFINALPLIEQYAFDDRNFVRKAVNWALRAIGKRNAALRPVAIACAERIRLQNTRSARWIAADALRELRTAKIRMPKEVSVSKVK